MTITYPRDMPALGLAECSFNLDENVAMVPSGRGLVLNRTQTMEPRWRATIATPILSRADQSVWSAWKKSLGGLRAFLAYDHRHLTPRAYPNATASTDISGGWNGTATVTSVNQTLGLDDLPAGYLAKIGDRVGLEEGGRYGYFELLEDATANGSGVATLTLAPVIGALLQGVFSTSAVARLWRPKCQFVLDPKSWREQSLVDPTPIAFEAVQLL